MAVSKKIKYTNNVAIVFRLVLLEYGKNLCDEHFSLKSFEMSYFTQCVPKYDNKILSETEK